MGREGGTPPILSAGLAGLGADAVLHGGTESSLPAASAGPHKTPHPTPDTICATQQKRRLKSMSRYRFELRLARYLIKALPATPAASATMPMTLVNWLNGTSGAS